MTDNICFAFFNEDLSEIDAGDLIYRTRVGRGLSIQQVTRYVGISAGQLKDIEAGRRPLPAERVHLLAKVLRLSEERIIDAVVRTFRKKYERRAKSGMSPVSGDAA